MVAVVVVLVFLSSPFFFAVVVAKAIVNTGVAAADADTAVAASYAVAFIAVRTYWPSNTPLKLGGKHNIS